MIAFSSFKDKSLSDVSTIYFYLHFLSVSLISGTYFPIKATATMTTIAAAKTTRITTTFRLGLVGNLTGIRSPTVPVVEDSPVLSCFGGITSKGNVNFCFSDDAISKSPEMGGLLSTVAIKGLPAVTCNMIIKWSEMMKLFNQQIGFILKKKKVDC